ncbi:MAG: hypothetical protein K6G61_12525 [Solobacterium sp.]|nr:hypothetical protein [Solobacterium sp.]
MRNKDIERKLRDGYEYLVIGMNENLSDLPAVKAQGDEWYLEGTGPQTGRQNCAGMLKPVLTLACAVLLFFGIQVYRTDHRAFATVYLDVNPSVSLTVNQKEKVIGVKTENRDGEAVLSGMDLKNTDVNTAVNALLGSMIRHGYLDEAHSILLLTVDCGSKEKADDLLYRLDHDVNEYLSAFLGTGRVIDREIRVDDKLQEQSSAYAISPSKADFINELIEGTDLRFEDLADLSITEIIRILRENGVREEDILDEIEDLNEDDEAEDSDNDDFEDHEDAVPYDSDDIDDDDFSDDQDVITDEDDADDFDDPEEDDRYEREEAGDPGDGIPYEFEDNDDMDENDADVIEPYDHDDEEDAEDIETDDHDDDHDADDDDD